MTGRPLLRLVPILCVLGLLLLSILAVPASPSVRSALSPVSEVRAEVRSPTAAPASAIAIDPSGPLSASTRLSGSFSPRPLTATPSSDAIETPPPAIPSTQPTTFDIASNLVCPAACTPTVNVTAPAGPWALILLNYTGSAVPTVYDSSYHASVNGILVLFGTTPELYTWTVLKDVTEYSALFAQTAQFQFSLGQATVGGHFVINVSLSFYPEPAGGAPPVVPNAIVPLWPFVGLSDTRLSSSVNATLPQDVQNATLELFSYGFSGSCGSIGCVDEFWYTNPPAYRAISVSVDGSPLATVQPFEYVNTGGIDLFLWDPVTAAYTANDIPYQVDVTAALGLLEGAHTFNATVLGLGHGSRWVVAGALLLYTNTSVAGATLASDSTPVAMYSNGSSGGFPTESVTRSYSYSSDLGIPSGNEVVSSWTNETFSATFIKGSGPNESGSIVSATTTFQESTRTPSGSEWRNSTSTPSIAFESGSLFVRSTPGTGYPYYGNATMTVYWFDQNWNRTFSDTVVPSSGPRTVQAWDSNDNVTANGTYVGEEKVISLGAAQLIGIASFWSNTSKRFTSLQTSTPFAAWYNHTIVAQLTPGDLSTDLATITSDVVQYSDASSLQESAAVTDPGQTNRLTARTFGFGAPFTYVWTGLPAGCGGSTSSVVCRPSAPGAYAVTVVAVSSFGQSAPANSVSWKVNPALALSVSLTPAAMDLSHSSALSLTDSGGLPPYKCSWFAGGVSIGPSAACPKSFSYTPLSAGLINVTVRLVDSLGGEANNTTTLLVVPLAVVSLTLVNPSSTAIPTLPVGGSLELTTSVEGGLPPFQFQWFIDQASTGPASASSNFVFRPTTSGNATISVEVTDADGITVPSSSVAIQVTGTSSGGNPGGGGGGGGTDSGTTTVYALIGVGIAVLAGVLLLVALTGRRRRSPPQV
ncbi:MAG: hypothetical protein L3J95_00265 [Thermoplasmata archaeon]|nr:hypothetical protein [Thermoplasmata archaeon]MCI4358854.1 hypothetical protein [Thermoplasmata archaeon]